MPIYEYQCVACRHRLEVLQNMADEALVQCPACHHGLLQKLISSTSFRLKGTGWYATDHASSKPTETKPTEDKPTADKPTETKPAEDKSTAA